VPAAFAFCDLVNYTAGINLARHLPARGAQFGEIVELGTHLHSIDSMGNFRSYERRIVVGLAELATAA
jgi:hypothetical protein